MARQEQVKGEEEDEKRLEELEQKKRQSNAAAAAEVERFLLMPVACQRIVRGLHSKQTCAGYELGKLLGKGAFGEVRECWARDTWQPLACKLIPKAALASKECWQNVKMEIYTLSLLRGQSRGVVSLQDALHNDRDVLVVMERCMGGDLCNLINARGPLPEASARILFRQLATALRCSHRLGIVHCDIKLENILLDRPADALYHVTPSGSRCSKGAPREHAEPRPPHGQCANGKPSATLVSACASHASDKTWSFSKSPPPGYTQDAPPPVLAKLADFGLATIITPGMKSSGYVGSRRYTAPEIVKGQRYGRRIDVWSLGVVLYGMLSGQLPFSGRDAKDKEGLEAAIVRGDLNLDSPAWAHISSEAKDLVSQMMKVDPAKRISASNRDPGKEILAHPWLSQHAP